MQVSVYTTHRDSLSGIPVRITSSRTADPDLELSCRSAARVPRATKFSQTRSASYLIKYVKGAGDAKLNVEEETAETTDYCCRCCAKYSLHVFYTKHQTICVMVCIYRSKFKIKLINSRFDDLVPRDMMMWHWVSTCHQLVVSEL
jgi:hypothetical protein